MLSSALLSLGVAGSALAWPSHSRHASIARALQAREEPVVANTTKAPVAATWFASWHAQDFPLSNVSWNKYTTVTYSFALTTPNVSFVNITDPDVFKDFVETAHANNVSASISVGGWTGSLYFSPAVATAENRTAFVKTMTDLVKDNNLDGLDFDWEYPGLAGIGCNALSANDTDNFLAFLTELRAALPNTTISAATSIKPFMSSDLTTPSTNVSAFASVFDYIAIMNYDIWGPWSDTVGPNAPLNDTCAANATQQVGSAVSAIEAWTKAGMPADQIVLGVAGYGHGFSVAQADALTSDNAISLYAPFNKTSIPAGDAWDEAPAAGAVDVCGNAQTLAGTWNFWGLVEGGFLNENGTANTAEGIVYKFDECSQTPYVYNKTSGIMVAFDDATSFAAKGQFINATGLRGFAMWEAAGDFDDILLDSIRNAAGFPAPIEDDDDGCGGDPSTGTTTDAAPAPTTTAASDPTTIADPEPTTIVDPEPTTVAAPAPTTKASNPSGATTKVSYGGSPTTKAGVAAAATTKEASSTRSTTASNPEPTADPADPDDEYDDDDCEDDDEDPETTSVAAATTASTSIAQATSTSQAASGAETSPVTSTVTSSAAAATATEDPDEECDDDEYDE